MKVGLFFGSFNPVHVGHMIIANYIVTHSDLDQVWLVVSPHNPHKSKASLAKDRDRIHLVRLAIGSNDKLRASDIEFGLSQPSYTVDTLAYAHEKYPNNEFVLIMGGDNLASFHKWKNYETIIKYHKIYVYKRPNYDIGEWDNNPNVVILDDAPLLAISASYIRKCIKENKSVQYLVTQSVFEYLEGSNMYK